MPRFSSRSAFKWAYYSHILAVVGWLFTLYCLLFRCAMVPRALAAIGMVASVLHFTGITLPAFAGYRMPFPELFGMPLGLANIVLAVWLMAKGFKEPIPRAPRPAQGRGQEPRQGLQSAFPLVRQRPQSPITGNSNQYNA